MRLRALGFLAGVVSLAALAAPADAQFAVRQRPLDTANNTANAGGDTVANQLNNIEEGEALLAGSGGFLGGATATASASVINYARGGDADFAGGANFPTGNGTTDQEDFGFDAIGRLTYNAAGSYVFRVNSDDGFRLRTGVTSTGTGGSTYSEFVANRGPANTDGAPLVRLAASFDDVRLSFYERGGGEEVEFSYSLNSGPFQLVGSNPAELSVGAIPEPASIGLLGLGGLGLLARRRRRA